MKSTAVLGVVDFANDAVLPAQWSARHGGAREWRPEHLLLMAILESALLEAARTDVRYAGPAHAYIFSEDVTWPASFLRICEVLGLDPSAVRRTVSANGYTPGRLRVRLGSGAAPRSGRKRERHRGRPGGVPEREAS